MNGYLLTPNNGVVCGVPFIHVESVAFGRRTWQQYLVAVAAAVLSLTMAKWRVAVALRREDTMQNISGASARRVELL